MDFRSLLSNFQDASSPTGATGGAVTTATPSGNNKSKSLTLREQTDRLWNIAQIRRASSNTRNTKLNKQPSKETVKDDKNPSNNDDDDASPPPIHVNVHIAICAVIVDELPQEEIWRKWIETTGGTVRCEESGVTVHSSAELYVHAKHPERIRSSWVKSKCLSVSYRPNWNDVRIVRAMIALAKEALGSKSGKENTTHILYCTESCIPIASLTDTATRLVRNGRKHRNDVNPHRSFVNCYNGDSQRCTRFDERSCWSPLSDQMPAASVHKALPGWVVLSAKHANAICNLPFDLTPAFENVWAPEEVYFPTALALLGYLPSEEVVLESLVHAEWDEKAVGGDKAHPIVYDDWDFGEDLIKRVRDKGCLFMRKFKRKVDPGLWGSVVLGLKGEAQKHESGYQKRGTDKGRYDDSYYHQQSQPKRGRDNNRRETRQSKDNDDGGYYQRKRRR